MIEGINNPFPGINNSGKNRFIYAKYRGNAALSAWRIVPVISTVVTKLAG
jgi:hypothetical protein